jgi:hypothetical protein
MTLLPASVPSLCIPRVFQNITKERVAYVFKSLGLGEIDHIDMIPRTSENGDKFQRVFIHFKRWSMTDEAVRARERVLGGKEIKVIYDDPWFWKISANRSTPRAPGSNRAPDSSRPRPRIVDDSASSDNDEGLRAAKSSAQHRKPHRGGPRNDREFLPQSPRDPPPSDSPKEEGELAWTRVDYGKVSETHKPKRRVVIKKPQLQVQEHGDDDAV